MSVGVEEVKVVDLAPITGNGKVRNLAGKARGEAARQELKIDAMDDAEAPVVVKVPEYVYAISSSFFLGLFSLSVAHYGSAEEFQKHYQFSASPSVLKQIAHGISRAASPRQVQIAEG